MNEIAGPQAEHADKVASLFLVEDDLVPVHRVGADVKFPHLFGVRGPGLGDRRESAQSESGAEELFHPLDE